MSDEDDDLDADEWLEEEEWFFLDEVGYDPTHPVAEAPDDPPPAASGHNPAQ